MSDLMVRVLHETPMMSVRDVECRGTCRHQSAEECAGATYLVFPYRGMFVHHASRNETMGDANQLVVFNSSEGYRISHPVKGGDACISVQICEEILDEMIPANLLVGRGPIRFHRRQIGVMPRAQIIAAQLRHRAARRRAEPLEVEAMIFALVALTLGERSPESREPRAGQRKIVNRAKYVLASDPARRWTSQQVADAVGVSPVYLTQLFQRVEGVPLYRYHLRLRLARALDLLDRYDDLTMLALDLGFSSHSHFTAAFRRAYGDSPQAFQRSAGVR